ncbi:MAG: hypothetical protein ABI401_11395 [Candidatus Dormibacter sp.]
MIKLPIAALVMVVVLLGGFYGGYKVGGGGQAAAAASGTNAAAGAGFAGRGVAAACPSPNASPTPAPSGRVAGRGTSGTITNLTSTSLTVHDARCNVDVKVTFSPTVIVRKTALGQVSDLQESETVTVVGTRQADGTVKANSIQIVPAGTGAGGFGGGAANGG